MTHCLKINKVLTRKADFILFFKIKSALFFIK